MGFDLLITFLLVFLNGFFVAAEFAIVKVRVSQLEIRVQAGNRAAKLAKHIISHLDGYLAATQLGITLASLGLGWIGEPVVSKIIINVMSIFGLSIDPKLAHDISLPVAFAIITVLHIVFGELAPKSIAIQRPERTTLFITYPLNFFYYLFRPFIWILNGIANALLKIIGIATVHGSEVHSSDELKYLVKQGRESGTIEEKDYEIIKNAFEFSVRTARQVMVPRQRVHAIDLNDFHQELIDKLIEESYSRIPCYEDNMDHIVGLVYLKDVLASLRKQNTVDLRSLIRPVTMVPENRRIIQILKDFQAKHLQMAIVINEYGGTEGIITMEDIIEELVGEIQDEFDTESPVVQQKDNDVYEALASAQIDDVNKFLPHEIRKTGPYDTLGGLLFDKFGRIPNVNEKITEDNYEFTILSKKRHTLGLIKLRDLQTTSVEKSDQEQNG